jgi:hypothetical protein
MFIRLKVKDLKNYLNENNIDDERFVVFWDTNFKDYHIYQVGLADQEKDDGTYESVLYFQ